MSGMTRQTRHGQRRDLQNVGLVVCFGLAAVIALSGSPRVFLRGLHGASSGAVGSTPPSWWPPEPPALANLDVHAGPASSEAPDAEATLGSVPKPPANAMTQLIIPRIGLQAEIVEVRLSGGEWQVPRSVVGHLAESVSPGEVGNAVFAGHVIAAGRDNVFARLHELRPGDQLGFVNHAAEQRFHVTDIRLVRNTDVSVLGSNGSASIVTLITCAGQWMPRENDYDQRLVVIASYEGVIS